MLTRMTGDQSHTPESIALARHLRGQLKTYERKAMDDEDWSFKCGFLLARYGACYPVDKLYDAAWSWRLFGSEADAKRT